MKLSDKDKARIIDGWRLLYYNNLLSDKECISIVKKINKKFKIDLSKCENLPASHNNASLT